MGLYYSSRARSLQRIHDASQLLDVQHLCFDHDCLAFFRILKETTGGEFRVYRASIRLL